MLQRGVRALGTTVLVVSLLASPAEATEPSPSVTRSARPDALERRIDDEIGRFVHWLERYDVRGYVGEFGWPSRPRRDAGRWAGLAERWLDQLDQHDVWATQWATGEWWGPYKLAVYGDERRPPGLDTAHVQATTLEHHLASRGLAGVNVSGAEFGTPPSLAPTSSFSSAHPGQIGDDYHYDGRRSFGFLARRGIELVRLQFRWERIQRQPGGPLYAPEVCRLSDAIGRAHRAGLRVIVDLHNYGDYYLEADGHGVRRPLGSEELPLSALADVWRRLAQRLGHQPGVLGWGLMNEPAGLPGSGERSPAEQWEVASQGALTAIRSTGDRHLVLVQGYSWAGAQTWPRVHPDPWIHDPAHRFRYEAHHYWDRDSSGTYAHSYAAEVRNARRQGY
jgi:Cellulase (glycosyl hydrolase family 5)